MPLGFRLQLHAGQFQLSRLVQSIRREPNALFTALVEFTVAVRPSGGKLFGGREPEYDLRNMNAGVSPVEGFIEIAGIVG
jgi:hypothetical protein